MIRGGAVVFEVRDVAQAVRFYIETLGMKLVREEPGGEALIDAGDGFLIELRPGTAAAKANAVLLFPKVPIEEAIAIYENRGVSFAIDRGGDSVVARFEDPDGNRLALIQGK